MVNAMVVYAGPIEQVLMGHPDVAEAYVAGAPTSGAARPCTRSSSWMAAVRPTSTR